jgi:hypothetical protein
MSSEKTKQCISCGAIRPISYFALDKATADGHVAICVACEAPEKWAMVQEIKSAAFAAEHGFTEEELRRLLWLRAVEWANWPVFLSQPIAPILFIFLWWPYVLASVIFIDILWAFVRYSFVSISFAKLGPILVAWTKWPAAIGSSIYLFIHGSYVAATIALLWPLVAGFMSIPAQVGRIELLFAKKIGYVNLDAEI